MQIRTYQIGRKGRPCLNELLAQENELDESWTQTRLSPETKKEKDL